MTLWIGAAGWFTIAEAACPRAVPPEELATATSSFFAAWKRLDAPAVQAAWEAAETAVVCTTGPLAAPEIVQVFQMRGLAAFLGRDMPRVRASFRAAVGVLPDYGLPSTAASAGDDWYEMYEALRMLPDEPRAPVGVPAEGWVQVDGSRRVDAPQGRIWLFQQFDAGGRVVHTEIVDVGDPWPEVASVAPPPDTAGERHGLSSWTLLGLGAGSVALGGLGLLGAASLRSDYQETGNDALVTPNLLAGSAGWTAVAGGGALGVSAVLVKRW